MTTSEVCLADGNVLIALSVLEHVHHAAARRWLADHEPTLATCPITEGTLLRFLIREGVDAPLALSTLTAIRQGADRVFWPADLPFAGPQLRGVIGHRQVTDAYLAALARDRGGRLITFDKGLATIHGDVVDLIQT